MATRKISFTVDHPGDHEPSPAKVAGALRAELHASELKRAGDYTVVERVNVSGDHTDYVVELPVSKAAAEPKGE